MHMIIRTIVYAKDEQEALAKARNDFDSMSGEGKDFDYFHMFDDEGTPVSGKGRWGNLPAVALATSTKGKKLIEDGFRYTKESFIESLSKVREALITYNNEELFDEVDKDMFKYRCGCIGQYSGSEIYLYHEGEGIRSQIQLNNVLSKYEDLYKGKDKPNKDLNVYVVPADVHF